MRKDRAFTLIELLVVISIISLLSSVVLSSLNSARLKANTSAARSEMLSIIKIITVAQGEAGRTLSGMTGSTHTAGNCLANEQAAACSNAVSAALTAIGSYAGGIGSNLSDFVYDPWGTPYFIDENQGEAGWGAARCVTLDVLKSAGPDRDMNTADDILPSVAMPLSPFCS